MSGRSSPPNDSLSTLTWSTATAQFIPWMIVEVNALPSEPNTFIAYSVAPGATPSILMLQPVGSGLAALVSCDRS